MAQLSFDFDDPRAHPYFLWSEDMTVADFREVLTGSRGSYLQTVYLGRLLREARIADVWKFVRPEDVASKWTAVEKHLGRRRRFWTYLLEVWREQGLLAS